MLDIVSLDLRKLILFVRSRIITSFKLLGKRYSFTDIKRFLEERIFEGGDLGGDLKVSPSIFSESKIWNVTFFFAYIKLPKGNSWLHEMPWKVCETSALNRDKTTIKRAPLPRKLNAQVSAQIIEVTVNTRSHCRKPLTI